MPQPKKYKNRAEQQAAYRARKASPTPIDLVQPTLPTAPSLDLSIIRPTTRHYGDIAAVDVWAASRALPTQSATPVAKEIDCATMTLADVMEKP